MKRRKTKKPQKTKPVFRQEVPDWFKALRASGGHGSNVHQKRLWGLVSEYVRMRDFKQYGYCVACKKRFPSWKGGQAGHFRAWSLCNGMFKFNEKNLALICSSCNFIDDGVVNAQFADEMRRRHGADFVEWVLATNNEHRGTKLDVGDIIAYAEEIKAKAEAL